MAQLFSARLFRCALFNLLISVSVLVCTGCSSVQLSDLLTKTT